MLSYGQIREWVAEQFHEDPSATVFTTTLFLRWVNETLERVSRSANWKWLQAQRVFDLGGHGAGANTQFGVTYFPNYVGRLVSVWPGNRGFRDPIAIIGAGELDTYGPSTSSGTISEFLAVWGYYSVARDMPVAGTVTATATAGAAGNGTECRIEGIDNGTGEEVSETVTLAGAGTAVTGTTFRAGPDGVRRIYIHDASVTAPGTVNFTETVSGTQIESINVLAGDRVYERIRTELSPAPAAGTAEYLVRYFKRARPVRSTDDVVDVPFEFENLVMLGMGHRMAEFRKEHQLAVYYHQSFVNEVIELKKWQNREPGRMRGLRRLSTYGYKSFQGAR